jgi:hypothetical protein
VVSPCLAPTVVLRQRLRPNPAHRAQSGEEAFELDVGHPVEQPREVLSAFHREVPEYRVAGIRRMDEDDPPILWLAPSLDQAALLHPIDDPGRARHRHIERLGQLAHRERAVGLEDRENVQVDETQRPTQPLAQRAGAFARVPRGQLLEEVVDGPPARGRPAFIQWHVDNLCHV